MSKAILAFNSFFAPKGKITALHSLFFFLNQWTSRGLPACMRGGEGWGSDGGVECLAGMGLGDGQKEPLKLCLSLTRMVLVDLEKERSTNIGGEFTNLEDLEVLES
ncbi:hypothetical protein Tco_1159910 [Tanacetum coccineum]